MNIDNDGLVLMGSAIGAGLAVIAGRVLLPVTVLLQ